MGLKFREKDSQFYFAPKILLPGAESVNDVNEIPNCAAPGDLQLLRKEAWLTRCRSLHCVCMCVGVCDCEKRRFRYSVCWASVIKRRELCVFHAALLSLRAGVKRVRREFYSECLEHRTTIIIIKTSPQVICSTKKRYRYHLKHFCINSHAHAQSSSVF